MSEVKACIKCGITKPLTDFYKRGDDKTKYRGICKDCSAKTNAEWLNVPANRKKYTEYSRIQAEKARRAKGVPKRPPPNANPKCKGVCTIIKKHHEDMKNDPERLSTSFIQGIVGHKRYK